MINVAYQWNAIDLKDNNSAYLWQRAARHQWTSEQSRSWHLSLDSCWICWGQRDIVASWWILIVENWLRQQKLDHFWSAICRPDWRPFDCHLFHWEETHWSRWLKRAHWWRWRQTGRRDDLRLTWWLHSLKLAWCWPWRRPRWPLGDSQHN